MDDLGGVRGLQAFQGWLPHQQPRSQCAPLHGLGRVRLHALVRHRRADGLLRRFRGRRRVRPVGLEHGGDAPDPVVAHHRSAAIISACQGGRAVHIRASLVRAGRHPDGVQAADGSHHPQRYRQPHHQDQSRQQGFRRQAYGLQAGPDRHRLRSAAGASAAGEGHRQGQGRRRDRHHVRSVRSVRLGLHPAEGGRRIRRAAQSHRSLGGALRGPQDKGHEPVDHGLQPAHAWRLGQQPRLQSAPADRQDLRARQQPVFADRAAVGMRHGARGRDVLASPARRHGRHQSRAPGQDRENLAAARGHDLRQAGLPRRPAEPDAEGRQAQRLLGAGEQQPASRRQHQSGGFAWLQEPRRLRRRVGCLPDRHHPGCRPRVARGDVGREGRRLRQFGAAHALLAPAREALRAKAARICGNWWSSRSASRSRRSGRRS